MSACRRIDCPGRFYAHGYCKRHCRKLMAAGLITGGLVDPGPIRARIDEHLARGRTLANLAAAAGIDRGALYLFRSGTTARFQVATAARIMAVPLPPTQIGTVRRLQAMARMGWTVKGFAAAAGIPRTTLMEATRRDRGFSPQLRIKVADAFERLAHIPGPSKGTARRAATKGWPAPWAWVDIDDPCDVAPYQGSTELAHGVDLGEVAWLTGGGVSLDDIATRMGVSVVAIERAQQRARRAA